MDFSGMKSEQYRSPFEGRGRREVLKLITPERGDFLLEKISSNTYIKAFGIQHLFFWVVVSNIFYFHPYLGKIPMLTNIFQRD